MLDAPIRYNGVDLNTVIELGDGKRAGCIIEEFDYGQSQGIGYSEKRSQDDGLDVSDVFMGARRISLTGTIYGETVADLFDRLQELRTIFTPTVALAVGRPDHGFIPLTFSLPTLDENFPTATPDVYVKELEFRCRPVGQPAFSVRRDNGAFNGAGTGRGGAISWQADLMCADPRMYVRPDVWVPFTGAVTGAAIVNRGDYPAPLDILLGVTSSAASSRIEIDVGGSNLTINLGALTNAVVRYSGTLKVLTLEVAGTEALRMDMLAFRNDTTHPKVQAQPGQVYNVRLYGAITLAAGTRLMYAESFS